MLIFGGCASSFYGGWQVRTNSTPVSPGFDPDDLEQHPVAVLSALGPPAFRGNEVALTYYLDEILHKVAPNWKIIPSREAATRINRQGLATDYSRMRSDYELTSILDRDSLRRIAAAIGARYVFQPRLADFHQIMQDRWTFPAANVRVTQTRSSIMRLSLSMWDAETGELGGPPWRRPPWKARRCRKTLCIWRIFPRRLGQHPFGSLAWEDELQNIRR